jgi:hypothetical protein
MMKLCLAVTEGNCPCWAQFFLASLLSISLAARLLAQANADAAISPANCDESVLRSSGYSNLT